MTPCLEKWNYSRLGVKIKLKKTDERWKKKTISEKKLKTDKWR